MHALVEVNTATRRRRLRRAPHEQSNMVMREGFPRGSRKRRDNVWRGRVATEEDERLRGGESARHIRQEDVIPNPEMVC